MMFLYILIILCIVVKVVSSQSINNRPTRAAIIITLSGNQLVDYFEWTCITIGASKRLFDMLVFHEHNSKLLSLLDNGRLHCASNVKFIDIGIGGLSKLVVDTIYNKATHTTQLKSTMMNTLEEVIAVVPRVLVEFKPMSGYLFKQWLNGYSHWTYSDVDIIWSDLSIYFLDDNGNTNNRFNDYDIITIGKHMDAGRLFLRG